MPLVSIQNMTDHNDHNGVSFYNTNNPHGFQNVLI